jgi:hypothetical protein
MKAFIGLVLVAMAIGGGGERRSDEATQRRREDNSNSSFIIHHSSFSSVRFSYLDIYLDSHDQPLAAYEFELKATSGDAKFVGVAGGDDRGFQDPPYYDQQRMQYQKPARIIIGAYSLADNLPKGKTRVARISVATEGDEKPAYAVRVIAAATLGGAEIPAEATFVEGAAQ